MNCDLFEETMSELVRQRRSQEDTVKDSSGPALDHIATCEPCTARLRDEEWLASALRALADSTREYKAPARVRFQLLEAHRSRFVADDSKREPSGSRFNWIRWSLGAAAALAAIALLAATLLKTQPEKTSSHPREQATTPQKTSERVAVNPTPQLVDREVKPEPVKRAGANRRSKRERRVEAAASAKTEVATEFIPVMYGPGLAPTEGGRLVRVELPRSALWSYGLPMNVDRANARIKADVIVGNDGMARAIRFVQ